MSKIVDERVDMSREEQSLLVEQALVLYKKLRSIRSTSVKAWRVYVKARERYHRRVRILDLYYEDLDMHWGVPYNAWDA